MTQRLDFIKKQIEEGAHPRAYLFCGNDESAKNSAVDYLLSTFLGKNYSNSPDFFMLDVNPIGIDDARALKSRASQKPLLGGKNVFLVKNIENLGYAAAPATLKFLEEPPADTIIIATTSDINAVLPTIKSRLSVFRFWEKGALSGGDGLKLKLASALERAEKAARANPEKNNILKFEKLLGAYKLISDPTSLKQKVGEYIDMIS